jgi:hypothetical protein
MTEDYKPEEEQNRSVTVVEQALMYGDFSGLSEADRLGFMQKLCRDMGIDIRKNPFQWIVLNGKLVPYAKKSCTDQLREVHHISIQVIEQKQINGAYVVQVRATNQNGRFDEDLGAAHVEGLTGDAYGNAVKKAITQAKRRVTLSICGLGMLDESEVENIPAARVLNQDGPKRILPPPAPPVVRTLPTQTEEKPKEKLVKEFAEHEKAEIPTTNSLPKASAAPMPRAASVPRAKMAPAAAPIKN